MQQQRSSTNGYASDKSNPLQVAKQPKKGDSKKTNIDEPVGSYEKHLQRTEPAREAIKSYLSCVGNGGVDGGIIEILYALAKADYHGGRIVDATSFFRYNELCIELLGVLACPKNGTTVEKEPKLDSIQMLISLAKFFRDVYESNLQAVLDLESLEHDICDARLAVICEDYKKDNEELRRKGIKPKK